jgi:hypothetical protein
MSCSNSTHFADIKDEEVRVGARDLLDPTYSVLARSLRTRTDNIRPPLPRWKRCSVSTKRQRDV